MHAHPNLHPNMAVTSVRPRADRPPFIPASVAVARQRPRPTPDEVAATGGRRPKRIKVKRGPAAAAGEENWVRLADLQRPGVSPSIAPKPPPPPSWPAPLRDVGAKFYAASVTEECFRDVASAAALLRALRLALVGGVTPDSEWMRFAFGRLAEAVRSLPQDDEFANDAQLFLAAERKKTKAPAALRHLQQCASLDVLAFALWALDRRQVTGNGGADASANAVPHPASVAAAAERLVLARPGVADALRRLLRPRAALDAAAAWGVRKAWLRKEGASKGSPWKPGACLLLQLLRARWCEAAAAAMDASLDAADRRVRASLDAWHFIGRDCGARWLAFVVPGASALAALERSGGGRGGTGVVELGAHNGYWAQLLAKKGVSVTALDIDPPKPARGQTPVRQGTADDLPGLQHDTLFLCMPPPGEAACAEEALEKFGGGRVAYVGEWNSGMTATRQFHRDLVQNFELEERCSLPCWPRMRAELFIFRRNPPGASEEGSGAGKWPLVCDACGCRGPLRLCPWTRHLRLCSEACFDAAKEDHEALLAMMFCGARPSDRPAFGKWLRCSWVDVESPSTSPFLREALRCATPQAEPAWS